MSLSTKFKQQLRAVSPLGQQEQQGFTDKIFSHDDFMPLSQHAALSRVIDAIASLVGKASSNSSLPFPHDALCNRRLNCSQ
jgi:hypothetical protein